MAKRLVGEGGKTELELKITDGPREDGSVGGYVFTGTDETGGYDPGVIVYQAHIPEGQWKK